MLFLCLNLIIIISIIYIIIFNGNNGVIICEFSRTLNCRLALLSAAACVCDTPDRLDPPVCRTGLGSKTCTGNSVVLVRSGQNVCGKFTSYVMIFQHYKLTYFQTTFLTVRFVVYNVSIYQLQLLEILKASLVLTSTTKI